MNEEEGAAGTKMSSSDLLEEEEESDDALDDELERCFAEKVSPPPTQCFWPSPRRPPARHQLRRPADASLSLSRQSASPLLDSFIAHLNLIE